MADLILLTLENGDPIRCTNLDDAKSKAITSGEGKIIVAITPEGRGGPMTRLTFDRDSQDWVPV